jgi:hypothetical protein
MKKTILSIAVMCSISVSIAQIVSEKQFSNQAITNFEIPTFGNNIIFWDNLKNCLVEYDENLIEKSILYKDTANNNPLNSFSSIFIERLTNKDYLLLGNSTSQDEINFSSYYILDSNFRFKSFHIDSTFYVDREFEPSVYSNCYEMQDGNILINQWLSCQSLLNGYMLDKVSIINSQGLVTKTHQSNTCSDSSKFETIFMDYDSVDNKTYRMVSFSDFKESTLYFEEIDSQLNSLKKVSIEPLNGRADSSHLFTFNQFNTNKLIVDNNKLIATASCLVKSGKGQTLKYQIKPALYIFNKKTLSLSNYYLMNEFKNDTIYSEYGHSVSKLSNGNYLIMADYQFQNGFTPPIEDRAYHSSLQMFEVDSLGNTLKYFLHDNNQHFEPIRMKSLGENKYLVYGSQYDYEKNEDFIYAVVIDWSQVPSYTGPQLFYAPNDIRVYPNPTTGNLQIHTPFIDDETMLEISIYNIEGKQVHKTKQPKGTVLELQHLPKGMYILSAETGEQVYRTKFIKQ